MKKTFLVFMLSIVALSCKPKQTVVSTKLDNKSERLLKGDWVVTKVDFVGSDYFKVFAFNIAETMCFEGSTWNFISNNNSGYMNLNSAACTEFKSKITWYINQDGNFVMKFLTEGVKAKHTPSGYVLKVANITENSFQLIDKASVGKNTAEIVYQFQRK